MIVAQGVSGSLLGPSALQAFRADTPVGGATPDAQDQATVLVATLIRQMLSSGGPGPKQRAVQTRAIGLAKASLGAQALAVGCTYDEHPSTSDIDVIRLLAQRTEHKGWLNLAQHLLESASYIAEEALDRGRVLSERARNSRKQGKLDLAEAQTEELRLLATRSRSLELMVNVHSSLGALAQTRGNLAAFKVHAEETFRLAVTANLTKHGAAARSALGTLAAIAGEYDSAVAHFWSAFRDSPQRGYVWNAALGNLAQTLLLSGRLLESRKVATVLLSAGPPLQAALPVLGGYAVSSARLDDVEAVDWACQQVRRLSKSRHHPRDVAGALIECAAALELIGRAPQAGVLRRRAVGLAVAYGFHDLTFTEALDAVMGPTPERTSFKGEAAQAETEIGELVVPRFPALFTTAV